MSGGPSVYYPPGYVIAQATLEILRLDYESRKRRAEAKEKRRAFKVIEGDKNVKK